MSGNKVQLNVRITHIYTHVIILLCAAVLRSDVIQLNVDLGTRSVWVWISGILETKEAGVGFRGLNDCNPDFELISLKIGRVNLSSINFYCAYTEKLVTNGTQQISNLFMTPRLYARS